MRLVCPNCEAKYEVPDDAIPETGRDVQCANCGHAWFQMRQKPVVSAPEAAKAATAPAAGANPARTSDHPADVAPSVAPGVDDTVLAPETPSDPGQVAAAVADEEKPIAPPPYEVDDSVLAILREEAQREVEARKADRRPLESQPDLGLDTALPPSQKPPVMPKVEEASAAKPSARRDLLPDVEEINSTLRPSEQPAEPEPATRAPPVTVRDGGGFRSGFLAVMTVAILGTALYVSAPTLGSAVPALAEPLQSYVSFIDGMRLHLDGLMKSATVAINGDS